MAALVGGSALGAAFELLFSTVIGAAQKAADFNSDLRNLKSTLDSMKQAIEDLQTPDRMSETSRFEALLNRGTTLVLKCVNVKRNFFKKLYYSRKLSRLDLDLQRFSRTDFPVIHLGETKKVLVMVNRIAAHLERIAIGGPSSAGWCKAPTPLDFVVGMEKPLNDVMGKLLEDAGNVLVVSAPGGCGKTTLAKKVCHHQTIKGKFGHNIFYLTVSRSPNLHGMVQQIFQAVKNNPHVPNFQTNEDAINQLEHLFSRDIIDSPVLLVLDDVWHDSSGDESLIEKFILNKPGYKILVTSRCVFPRFNTYRLKPLSYQQAVELFCHNAFENGNCSVHSDLVKKVVKCCGGFPLALTVVGRSLYNQHEVTWRSRISKWSNGRESILTTSNDLLSCLRLSLEALDQGSMLECFLDLGLFSEDQKIPVTTLLDMWVELYNMNEDDSLACLRELFNRNLVDLMRDRTEADDIEYCNEQFATQHDLLRELTIYISGQEPVEYRRRVILDVKNNNFPKWWTDRNQEPLHARIMSISTDKTSVSDWHDIKAPEVEIFISNFRNSLHGTLPLHCTSQMRNLKALILTNNGSHPAKLHNFPSPDHLENLKTIRLEHISIPSIFTSLSQHKNLLKMSLVMCEIGETFQNYTNILPNLVEINIEYNDDLVELPVWFFTLDCLKKLAISHCPELESLPEELGDLINLEMLRLHSCTTLQELPESIGNLQKLRFFDLSDCVGIEYLPEEMGQLRCLWKMDMRGCRGLLELPLSVQNLVGLERVTCDEETASLWGYRNECLNNLEVRVIKEEKNLNWLHNLHA